jgi:cytochrome c oxidase assembly factor CtaG
MSYVKGTPTVTCCGHDLATTSVAAGGGCTVVAHAAVVLLLVLGSPVLLVTLAVFDKLDATPGAVAVMVMTSCAALASEAIVHLYVPAVSVHVPVPVVNTAERLDRPTGSVSLTTMLLAVSGPLLVTVSV